MKSRRRSRGRAWMLLAFVVIVTTLFWLTREIGGSARTESLVRVLVPKGSTVRAVADSLQQAGVIGSPRLFRWFASSTGRSRAIKPGAYQFSRRASYSYVLDALVSGRSLMHTVTIPEGYDVRDIAPLIAKALSVSEDSVRAVATDTAWRRRLNVPAPTVEGYFFPATYSFADGTTARDAMNEMLERFEAGWKPEWNARLDSMSISRHAAITMASIVEKEARKPEERAIISAVYWNRVKKGMLLQADPTVQYALPTHVERVLFKDLEIESKYNTYKYAGLPPGPIASPGEASIVAALNPANVPYLYFVAHPDGHHEFRTTFAEHSRAIVDIKRQRRQMRATPSKPKSPS